MLGLLILLCCKTKIGFARATEVACLTSYALLLVTILEVLRVRVPRPGSRLGSACGMCSCLFLLQLASMVLLTEVLQSVD